jgi:hypothetical protein
MPFRIDHCGFLEETGEAHLELHHCPDIPVFIKSLYEYEYECLYEILM